MRTKRCIECGANVELDSRGGPETCPECSSLLEGSRESLLTSSRPRNQDLFSVQTLEEDAPEETSREARPRTHDNEDQRRVRTDTRSTRRDRYEDEDRGRRRDRRDEEDDYQRRGRHRDDDYFDDEDMESRLSRRQREDIKEAVDGWRGLMLKWLLGCSGLCMFLILITFFFNQLFLFGILFGLVIVALGFQTGAISVRVKNGEPGSNFKPGMVAWIFPLIGFTSYPHPLLFLILGLGTSVGSLCIYALGEAPKQTESKSRKVAAAPVRNKPNGPIVPPPRNPIRPNWPRPGPPIKPNPGPGPVVPKVERLTYPPPPPTPGFQTPPTAKDISGLVGYWNFDKGVGTTAVDVSGNGQDAQIHEGKWVEGVRGKGLELNGVTADVTIPNSAKLNFAKNQGFTIAGWVKLASGGEEGTILAFVNTKGRSLILLEVSKGQPVAKIRKDSSGFDTGVRGNDQLPPGRWQHLAMARHPDGTLELFVNGESVKRAKHRAHFAVADGIVKTDSRAIGKYLRHSRLHRNERRPFKGMLDEFCIFDRVLTERAVIVLAGRLDPMYLAGKIEPPRVTKMPGLLAHWSFDEGKGEIVVDGSDNRLLGTLKGAKWVDGVVGKAVEFDGKSTYLKFERSPKMNFPKNGPFTITGWVKPAETEGTILSFRNGKEDGGLIDLHMHQGKLHVQVRQDGSIFSPTQIQSVVLPQGKWSHFLLSRNPNGNVTLLLNGKGGISRNTPLYRHSKGPISADLCVLGCEKYWVDKNYRGANEDRRWFRGAVDELYVFGRELNTEELATLLARK